MKKKKKKLPWIILIVVLLIVFSMMRGKGSKSANEQVTAPAERQTAETEQ